MLDTTTAVESASGVNFAFGIFAAVLILYLAVMGLGLADYIITSLSLYTMADRRRIQNPWLAWLPVANNWIIGSIVDCNDGQKGIKSKWRTVLLILSLAFLVSFVAVYIVLIVFIIILGIQADSGDVTTAQVIGFILPIYIALIVIMLVGVAQSYCRTICIYKIYENACPEKAIKYIILSLLVPLAGALCLNKCKDSMNGVPQPAVPYSYPTEQNNSSPEN